MTEFKYVVVRTVYRWSGSPWKCYTVAWAMTRPDEEIPWRGNNRSEGRRVAAELNHKEKEGKACGN